MSLNWQENVSLKRFNTFGLDYQSRYFVEVENEDQLQFVLKNEVAKKHPLLIIGGGSNLLLTGDFHGLAVKNSLKGYEIVKETDEAVFLRIGAGENWHQLVLYAVNNGWGGIENLSLIPGTVGAAPMQNIGAYGVEICEVFDQLEALNRQTGAIETFNKEECQFGYRESVFKKELKDHYVITRVVLRFSKKPKFNISYGAIQTVLDEMGVKALSLKSISEAVISIRQSKLPDPAEIGNAGSFFKNPVVKKAVLREIKSAYPTVPFYEVNSEEVKIPAAWLIEQSGWKGKRIGNIGVHKNQALVLVNYGDGDGAKIKDLAFEIQKSVNDKFGIKLHPEVNIV